MCAESQVACNKETSYSGGNFNITFGINIGTNGTRFRLDYNAYWMPDRFSVFLPNGTQILDILAGWPTQSGQQKSAKCNCNSCVGVTYPNGGVALDRPVGVSWVRVVVNGYSTGTGWKFTVARSINN